MKRVFAAFVLSILQPGLGQALNRQVGKGIIFLLLSPVLVFAAGLTNLLHTALGLVAFAVLGGLISLWALVDAVYVARRRLGQPLEKFNRWALTLALVLASTNMLAGATGFYITRVLHVHAYVIASNGMNPTLRVGDRIMVDTAAFTKELPRRGDVVVFVRSGFGETMFPKRVIGKPGDQLEGGDTVKINGEPLQESYLAPPDSSMTATVSVGPTTVPPNHYFVMGDFRQNSLDSREYGPIDLSQIKGKVLYMYWSRDHSRIGKRVE
jgi:signal peptidase I